jgi:hypothetical protein
VCLKKLKKGFPQDNFIINNDKNYGENARGNPVEIYQEATTKHHQFGT